MGRANVYLPDDLERRVKAAQIPISEVCQRALLAAVESAEQGQQPFDNGITAEFQRGWEAGAGWTKTAPVELLLTLLRDQRLAEVPPEVLPHDLYSLTEAQALAWEAGFMAAGRASIRIPSPGASPAEDQAGSAAKSSGPVPSGPVSLNKPTTDTPAGSGTGPESPAPQQLGDDSGCQIGLTLDGHRVCFDPHAAVRAGKSPLFAILGSADDRARLALSVAQDAASRGAGVVLVDLSGELTSRASGLGKNVRVVRRPQAAMPRLEDLVQGAVGLGGLWETVSGLSRGTALTQLFSSTAGDRIEPGYVTVVELAGEGQLGAAVSAMQLLAQLAARAKFPRLVHVDLPAGISIPAGLASRLGRIVRTAREQNAAIGLSAENADTVAKLGGSGALLSTAIAFGTASPLEADRLRNLMGSDAPILLDPPGPRAVRGEETWAAMRDLHGRLGQLRMEGW